MSRSGYSEDIDDDWAMIRYRGAVKSAFRGKRGQAFLREMLEALDKYAGGKLIDGELEAGGLVCAIGSVGKARGVDMSNVDPEDADHVAAIFNIAPAMAREIVFENDEAVYRRETPEQRFTRMREWIKSEIAAPTHSERAG